MRNESWTCDWNWWAFTSVVDDIDVARQTLVDNGVDVSDVDDMGGGIRYAYFSDPDGNSWALQQIAGADSARS